MIRYLSPRARTVAGVLLAAAVLSGCGASAAREDGALRTGRGFAAALAAGEYETACALLAPASKEQMVEDEEAPCGPALRSADVPPGGAALGVEVYGRQALVRMEDDTLFLSLFDHGWRVTAAGCEPRSGDVPYRCSVKGS